MAIDIRATVTCSLGTLISGSISDDYIQGSGLVKTRGSVEISGTITPAIGTAVTFSYVKGGVTRSIPRKLRVLSSFADPFRRTTKVELGCKLTYLSDLKEPIDWSAFDDPENASYDANDARIVTLPLHASSVMNKCLSELDITASSNPLTNKFSIAEFDFSAGYVQVLSDLLVSESYCGYLDTNEVLQVFNLDQDAGTGPVFTSADIVDLAPIGVGQLPGEAVTVSFSTLKLKDPDSTGNSSDPWVYTVSRGAEQSIKVGPSTYSYIPETITETEYEAGGERRITKQTVTKTTIAAEAGGSYLEAVYAELGSFPVSPGTPITEVITTVYEYDIDSITVQLPNGSWYYTSGEITRTTTLTKESILRVIASFNLPWVVESTAYTATTDTMVSRKTVQVDETVSGYTRTITNGYAIYGYTQEGQQLIALAGQNIDTLSSLNGYVSTLLSTGALILTDTSVNVQYGDSRLNNRLPPVVEINNAAYANGGDPNNGWRTESQADLELAVGSATAQRRIELSMPYAPDDTFSGPSGGPFTATASDAPAKANRYGRVQNRLLLGNRSGINLQLAPEKLPAAPYSPLYVQASGLTALYRANGTNWAFDSNGIVCSVDALFWAAVGGTGTFWFPVAPGVTTLPTTPPIVAGEMSATATVLPYNETAIYDSRIRLTSAVTKFDYSLNLLTTVPISRIRTVTRLSVVVSVPVASTTLATLAAGETGSLAIPVDAANTVIAGQTLLNAGDENTVYVNTANIGFAGLNTMDPLNSIVFNFDGSDGSTSIASSSGSAGSAVASVFGTAALDTGNKKFGTASLYLDGPQNTSGDWITFDLPQSFGLNDFCVEFWVYTPSSAQGSVYATIYSFGENCSLDIDYSSDYYYLYVPGTVGPDAPLVYDQWQHIAIYRIGGVFYLAVDGVVPATSITASVDFVGTTNIIGEFEDLAGTYVVTTTWIDEVRVTFDSAVYGTTNFSPPTGPF